MAAFSIVFVASSLATLSGMARSAKPAWKSWRLVILALRIGFVLLIGITIFAEPVIYDIGGAGKFGH